LQMPSPEDLGLTSNTSAAANSGDWTVARQRLDNLGASYYRLEKADGGFRFVCSLPYSGDPTRERHFESLAASEPEAIRLALGQVNEWKATQK
jgi:hypothetical protein